MPTVLRIGRFRFGFFSNEGKEPPHVHVRAGEAEAKFWLDPIELEFNYGFNVRELNEVESIISEHRSQLTEAWYEHFQD